MRAPLLGGLGPAKQVRTTKPCACTQQPSDLLRHDISVHAPHERWLVDFTYMQVGQVLLHDVRHGHALAHGLGWAILKVGIRASHQVLSSRPPDRQASNGAQPQRAHPAQ